MFCPHCHNPVNPKKAKIKKKDGKVIYYICPACKKKFKIHIDGKKSLPKKGW